MASPKHAASQPPGSDPASAHVQELARHSAVALRSMGQPNSFARQFDFWDDRYAGRRLFAEVLGTFLLVLVAVGGGMVNVRFGGHAVPPDAQGVAPLLLGARIGKLGSSCGTLLCRIVSATTDMLWELVLTAGLVSVILGTASGAQQLGSLAAIGVGSYIALAGLWG